MFFYKAKSPLLNNRIFTIENGIFHIISTGNVWLHMIAGVYFSTNKLLVIYDSQTKDFESLILWSITHSLLWLAFENKVLLKSILMPK